MSDDKLMEGALQEVLGIAGQIEQISRRAVLTIAPQVNEIIDGGITDRKRIEQLLDTLMDYVGVSNDALVLFKRLCRYYYKITPMRFHSIYTPIATCTITMLEWSMAKANSGIVAET